MYSFKKTSLFFPNKSNLINIKATCGEAIILDLWKKIPNMKKYIIFVYSRALLYSFDTIGKAGEGRSSTVCKGDLTVLPVQLVIICLTTSGWELGEWKTKQLSLWVSSTNHPARMSYSIGNCPIVLGGSRGRWFFTTPCTVHGRNHRHSRGWKMKQLISL